MKSNNTNVIVWLKRKSNNMALIIRSAFVPESTITSVGVWIDLSHKKLNYNTFGFFLGQCLGFNLERHT